MKHLISSFSILHRQSDIFLTKKLSNFGVTSNQFVYIMCLCEHPGISQEQLANLLRIDKGAVSKAVRQMTELGYIDQTVSESDKRQYKLMPTRKATDLYPTLYDIIMEYERYITRNLTPIEADVLRNLLDKLTGDI